MTIKTDIDQLVADAAKVHSWATGSTTHTETMGVYSVRSPAKLIADKDAEINTSASGVLTQATTQAANASASATSAAASATTATAQATAAASSATSASSNAAAVSAALTSAAAIVNGNLLVTPNRITQSLTIPDGSNALLITPVDIDPSVTITGLGNSTLRGI